MHDMWQHMATLADGLRSSYIIIINFHPLQSAISCGGAQGEADVMKAVWPSDGAALVVRIITILSIMMMFIMSHHHHHHHQQQSSS